MSAHPLDIYLEGCRARYKTGATLPEVGLYHPLETLLNTVGERLKKPRVRCFMNLKSLGGDMPDGGLFTVDQMQGGKGNPVPGQKPARGVIECKRPGDDIDRTAASDQVSRYWNRYNQVLVTNYREFALIGRDANGNAVRHEFHQLADSEQAFWKIAGQREAAVAVHGQRLLDFLERCLRRPVPLTEPKDVAWFLASYARDARSRVEHSKAITHVQTIRKALEDALGLKVQDVQGAHFFESTLVQTLFYGIFSAWVLWHRSGPKPSERFEWEKSAKYLHVPILRKLFRELTDPTDLDEWDNLTEVMGWAADTLARVERSAFFTKFRDAEAVQYFYEPFLEAFDPELRKQLGVWYTPPEIVKYMVARVDQVLKSDFGKADGLADADVMLLDPCCGTGAYLVEALNVIEKTLRDKGNDALLAAQLKKAATTRIFGFEILPAPFVVSHLQLGLFLQQHGAGLVEKKHERAAVYLTNSLTGWKPPAGPKQKLLFPEMEEERDKAERVKQAVQILVVIGNPPYNGFAGIPVDEEAGLVEPYRTTKRAPKPQGQGLNDLYIRFFRVAERCITERHARHGIVCYISNYSWLDGRSHTGMRERFLEEFDQIWIDSLNGDKYKTGKTTPEGKPDPSVFSTPQNREGIQVGTAITLLARNPTHKSPASIRFLDFWGERKRDDLTAHAGRFLGKTYLRVSAVNELALQFRPVRTEADFICWPSLESLFPNLFAGVQTKRDDLVVDIDLKTLRDRMSKYFDRTVSHLEMTEICPRAMQSTQRFNAVESREYLLKRGLKPEYFVRFAYRPFDIRWVYWEPETRLLGEKVGAYFPHVFLGNTWLFSQRMPRREWSPAQFGAQLACLDLLDRGASCFPMLLKSMHDPSGLFKDDALQTREIGPHIANLSDGALTYLNRFKGVGDNVHLFHHVMAIVHAPNYSQENKAALRQDWPRVPLPPERAMLVASADLGRRVAALLDPETPVKGVTEGRPSPALKSIAVASRIDGGQLNGDDFALTARWGIAGKGGITMPSTGKVIKRPFDDAEKAVLSDAIAILGPDTRDIYLNNNAYWRNVPRRVWEYSLGGYQVLKKWLSYREKALLGRPLTVDEVEYVTSVARRIAALLLMGPELDANYETVKRAAYEWKPDSSPQS